jgi:hypothetical protein
MMNSHRAIVILALLVLIVANPGCLRQPGVEIEKEGLITEWTFNPFPWKAVISNFRPSLDMQPGSTWSFDYDVQIDLRQYEKKYGKFTHLILGVLGEWRYDDEGYFRSGSTTFAISSNLTTTGIPIERFDRWPSFRLLQGKNGSPIEAIQSYPLPAGESTARIHSLQGQMSVPIPADAPLGYYEPTFYILAKVEGVPDPVHLGIFGYEWNDWAPFATLPVIKVGEAATPRMPWSILAEQKIMGRSGVFPEEYEGHAGLCARSGFSARVILPPGKYVVSPNFPTIFPRASMAPVDGGNEVIPGQISTLIDLSKGSASCKVRGPRGEEKDYGTQDFVGPGENGPSLSGGGFFLDLTSFGDYEITLKGHVADEYERRYEGGGTYRVSIANPLTFSTSCKPGTSFMVGGKYSAKVNVLPPFPASVEVRIEYYPNSDPDRMIAWTGQGHANRFGHFVPHGTPPLVFDEPGEYMSLVTARYEDSRGGLWMGQQRSVGVVAPEKRNVILHGTRSFPYNNRLDKSFYGAVKQFDDRNNVPTSFMPDTPYTLMDPFAPYNPEDTLFLSFSASTENIVEPHISLRVQDPVLAEKMIRANIKESALLPQFYQPPKGPWKYIKDVLEISTDSFGFFSVEDARWDEIPILPAGKDGWHPSMFPQKKTVEAYATMGIVRPGFPVMTLAFQTEAVGMYWLASPNRFGHHFNAGINGDLPGDLYRIQAGVVIKDLETDKNYYDAYGTSIAVVPATGSTGASSILAPGERPLVSVGGRDHYIFLAIDTHDVLEVGEKMGLGGMVFPNIPADVSWTVTKPSGEVAMVFAKADRFGIARGRSFVPVEEPGIYKVRAHVSYGELEGDIVGTPDGEFWHCAVYPDGPNYLQSEITTIEGIDPKKALRIPVVWPEHFQNARLHFAVLMPGQVIDQGVVEGKTGRWEYPFDPIQLSAQFPNFDVRILATGQWELADTLVFQFFLEAENDGEKVFDSLRMTLRRDKLYNYESLIRDTPHPTN